MSRYKRLQSRVEELEEQLEDSFKDTDFYLPTSLPYPPFAFLSERRHVLTLAGKVEAIIEHLGINLEVKQKKTTGPSVKITKKGKK